MLFNENTKVETKASSPAENKAKIESLVKAVQANEYPLLVKMFCSDKV